MSRSMPDFRCFPDDQVARQIAKLATDGRFLHAIGAQVFGTWSRRSFFKHLVSATFRACFVGVDSIDAMNRRITAPFSWLFHRQFARLQTTGFEQLCARDPVFFIANHRDIAMDALYLNYAMLTNKMVAARVAIGDNLRDLPEWAFDMMRLVGCFLVYRSVKGRQLLAASQEFAEYVRQLLDSGQKVWLAQRNGRAIDGEDRVESGIIKIIEMIAGQEGLADYSKRGYLRTATVSYEYDPCDQLKAEQLLALPMRRRRGGRAKNYSEQVSKGILGDKGRVSLVVGEPMVADNAQDLEQQINEQTRRDYKIWPSNVAAVRLLAAMTSEKQEYRPSGENYSDAQLQEATERLQARIAHLQPQVQQTVVSIYARPLLR